MRTVVFKNIDNEKIEFVSNLNNFTLDQEDPFGISYRTQCSSTLTEQEIEEFWSYVDDLLVENPTPNFLCVWKIVENGIIYGYEN